MGQHGLYMSVRKILFHIRAERVHVAVFEILIPGNPYKLCTLGRIEELPVLIEQFQGVPLPGIMRGSKYDASIGLLEYHGHLHCRRGGQAGIDHVYAACPESPAYYLFHHGAGDACIPSDHHLEPAAALAAVQHGRICRYEFYNIQRRKRISAHSSYSTSDT